MADKIQIGLDDQTDAGAASVEANLRDIANAADQVQGELNDAGKTGEAAIEELRQEVDRLGKELDEAERKFNEASNAAAKLGDKGKDVGKLRLRLTEINQGLELVRKVVGLVSAAINTMADEGDPAFVALRRSIEDVRHAAWDLARDPEISAFATGLADSIVTEFIPAMKDAGKAAIPVISNISEHFREAQRWISNANLEVGAFIGVFDEAVADELKLTKEVEEARRAAARAQAEQNRQIRDMASARKEADDIHNRVASDEELRSIAAIEDERQLNDLLQQEREGLVQLARTGESTGRTREEHLRRIEVIERRLVEIPRQRAEQEKRAAEEVRKAQADAMQEALDAERELQRQRTQIVAQAERERTRIQAEEANHRLQLLKMEHEERVRLIEQADGGKLLDQARQAIDPRAVRQQIAQQRGQQAAEQFTRERAGDLDASDAAAVRRFRAQREVARQQAERAAAQQFNRGQVNPEEIGRAQTALIQSAAQQAVASGNLSEAMGRALIEAANNQQRMTERLNQQEQQIQQVTRALQGVGQSNVNARQRAISGGFRR